MVSDAAPNYDSDAERAVLAACFDSRVARDKARAVLTAGDFWDTRHESIWEAFRRLDLAQRSVDHASVGDALGGNRAARELLPELVTLGVVIVDVETHAEIVRNWGLRRRVTSASQRAAQRAGNLDVNPVGLAAEMASEFAAIRDYGLPDTTTAETLRELLADPDDEPDWIIPGLLERRDRLMLTGVEGLGKSTLLRQLAILAAAGLQPFTGRPMRPVTCTIIDAENSRRQVKRKARPLTAWAKHYGDADVEDRVVVDCVKRSDLTLDKSLAEVHHLLDATHPDIVIIGPLYRLVPRGINKDDDAAPLLAALDTIRDRPHAPALLIEAHAGHVLGASGQREMRPRGSAALLGWPEFGLGLRRASEGAVSGADLVAWRGARDERQWPSAVKRSSEGLRWLPCDPAELEAVR